MRLYVVGVNPELLTRFCREEWPRLVGSLALYTGDRDLAEELAQESLIRVVQHWTQLDSVDPSGWARRVVGPSYAERFRISAHNAN